MNCMENNSIKNSLLNASDQEIVTSSKMAITTIPPNQVAAKLAPARIEYHDCILGSSIRFWTHKLLLKIEIAVDVSSWISTQKKCQKRSHLAKKTLPKYLIWLAVSGFGLKSARSITRSLNMSKIILKKKLKKTDLGKMPFWRSGSNACFANVLDILLEDILFFTRCARA